MCDECIKCVRDSKAKQASFNEPPASYSVRHTLKEEKMRKKSRFQSTTATSLWVCQEQSLRWWQHTCLMEVG